MLLMPDDSRRKRIESNLSAKTGANDGGIVMRAYQKRDVQKRGVAAVQRVCYQSGD
jgi:hypothetical protein